MTQRIIASKRIFISIILVFVLTFGAKAQIDTTHSNKKITEILPSINIVNVSKANKSFAIAGLVNVIKEKAIGLRIAGLHNHIGEKCFGLTIGGLGNTTFGNHYGMQIGGLYNITTSNTKGVAIAGLCNIFRGFENKGLQIAGLTNISQNAFGLQFSGLANVATNVKGMQFAGLINVANKVDGVQFASVLNIADESNFPIGIVNIIKNGEKGVALTYDVLNNAVLSFRSGGKYTYGIIGVGCNPQITSQDKVVLEAGYGLHIPICKWLELNNEIKATNISFSSDINNFSYYIAPSIKLWKHFNLFGGANFNYFMANKKYSDKFLQENNLWNKVTDERQHQIYIGYQVGVQYIF